MGFDQYAYVAANENSSKKREFFHWQKHTNLHVWMEQLWSKRGMPNLSNPDEPIFNCISLELTWRDIISLEFDILDGTIEKFVPHSSYFFNSMNHCYRERDLEFIRAAKLELFLGFRVFYISIW